MDLYHFTCSHGYRRLGQRGRLKPNLHLLLDVKLVWMTDMRIPDVIKLGLTNETLSCDRTHFRYVVLGGSERAGIEWWPTSTVREESYADSPGAVFRLEDHADPARWYISLQRVSAHIG
jgi:hypothetical protein